MRTSASLAVLASLNLLLTFGYHWYALTYLGPGIETDAVFASMTVPQLILAVLGGGLLYVVVPLLATTDEASFESTAWTLFAWTGVAFLSVGIFLGVSAAWWVPWASPGFDARTTLLVVKLVRILLLAMIFTALAMITTAAHQARHRFVWAECAAFLSSAGGLLVLVWGLPRFGVHAIAWAMVFRVAFQMILLLRGIGRFRWPAWRSNVVKQAWDKLGPLIVGGSYYKTENLLDRLLASMAPTGELSLFALSRQLYDAGATIISRAVVIPMTPRLAVSASKGQWAEYRSQLRRRVIAAGVLAALTVLAVVLVGHPVLSFVFMRRQFQRGAIDALFGLMIALGPLFIFNQISDVLAYAFYAAKDTATPTKLIAIAYTVGGTIKIIAFFHYGLPGLAWASSIYGLILGLFLWCGLAARTVARSRAVVEDGSKLC